MLAAGATVAALQSPPASAHGPCQGCIEPQRARVGETVRVDYPTYLAIWNPRKPVLTKGPKPDCYGCGLELWKDRVRGVASQVVFEQRPRVSEFQFEIPDVPPGRYLVALFDGSEGAGHYSWNFVTVEGPGADAEPDGGGAGDGRDSLLVVLAAAGVALLAAVGWLALRAVFAARGDG